ncbi:hypothetical protein NLJ89_g9977 [Agrocybe chaxingu]|uniref:YDG domain-containing protein n=1 Tax=Agrocybe chaxingu TaxID=84603 RepID=A0A9W8JS73_9AGAR|nr:hypothetical protein NLJ89_g9977 [Agrocybe chaxingu]
MLSWRTRVRRPGAALCGGVSFEVAWGGGRAGVFGRDWGARVVDEEKNAKLDGEVVNDISKEGTGKGKESRGFWLSRPTSRSRWQGNVPSTPGFGSPAKFTLCVFNPLLYFTNQTIEDTVIPVNPVVDPEFYHDLMITFGSSESGFSKPRSPRKNITDVDMEFVIPGNHTTLVLDILQILLDHSPKQISTSSPNNSLLLAISHGPHPKPVRSPFPSHHRFRPHHLLPIPIAHCNRWKFGHIEGFPVGYQWKDRQKLSDDGVHAPVRGGIHGRQSTGAFSLVLSGGYEDDHCDGNKFIYTGSGGNKFSLSLKQLVQVSDQQWKRGNRALQTSMNLNKPVRVIRGYGLKSRFAPATGYRYDGLYKVVSATIKPGKKGHLVCLFEMKRCPDQPPLPVSPALLASSSSRTSPGPEPEDEVEVVSTNFTSTSSRAEASESRNTATTPTVVGSPSEEPASTLNSQQVAPKSTSTLGVLSSQIQLPTPAPDESLRPGSAPSLSTQAAPGSSATLVASPPASRTGPSPQGHSAPSTPVASSFGTRIPQKRPRPRPITSPDRWAKKPRIASFEECLQSGDRDFGSSSPLTIRIRPVVATGAASPSRNQSTHPTACRGPEATVGDTEPKESLEKDGIKGDPPCCAFNPIRPSDAYFLSEELVEVIDLSGGTAGASWKEKQEKAASFLGFVDLTLDSNDEDGDGDVKMSIPTPRRAGGTRRVKQEEVQVRHLGFLDLTLDSDEETGS